MNRFTQHFVLLSFVSISFAACQKNDITVPDNQLRTKINYTTLTPTTNYFTTFVDAEGNSTVSFSGQTTRQDMLAELDSVMRIATGAYASKGVPANAVSANVLKNMYANVSSPFRQTNLNVATDKQLKGKTAGSFTAVEADAERTRIENWLNKLATASSAYNKTAADGQAGIAVTTSGSRYLLDEKGIEYGQLVQKGIIGAVLMDQMLNVYLGADKLALDNSKPVEGNNYTAQEHSWDEAYGYLTKNPIYPTPNPADATRYLERYLGNYVRPVGDPQQLYLALLKGRAAVVNNDVSMRNQQVTAIQQHVEKAIATFAISYLNRTKSLLASDVASAQHAFSEGAGFVYALRFGPGKKISIAKSDMLFNKLVGGVKGFYSLTPAIIDEVRNEVAAVYTIDPATVVSH